MGYPLKITDLVSQLPGARFVTRHAAHTAAAVRKLKKAQAITKAFFESNKPVASICHGPWTLASADVVKGRRLTSYWHDGVPEDVKAAGGKWEDSEVVVDGNLITSRYPMDLPAFMREIAKMTQGQG